MIRHSVLPRGTALPAWCKARGGRAERRPIMEDTKSYRFPILCAVLLTLLVQIGLARPCQAEMLVSGFEGQGSVAGQRLGSLHLSAGEQDRGLVLYRSYDAASATGGEVLSESGSWLRGLLVALTNSFLFVHYRPPIQSPLPPVMPQEPSAPTPERPDLPPNWISPPLPPSSTTQVVLVRHPPFPFLPPGLPFQPPNQGGNPPPVGEVPEPGALLTGVLGAGLTSLFAVWRRRQRPT